MNTGNGKEAQEARNEAIDLDPAKPPETESLELPGTASELVTLVYDELRRLAAVRLGRERPGQTLQPTALVHEAWLRIENGSNGRWKNRSEFFATAAEAMRRILIERARRKQAAKRGAGAEQVELDPVDLPTVVPDDQLLAINDALEEFAREEPKAAELVKLRFFVGLPHQEAAESLGMSRSTADRAWVYARAWLADRISHG